PKTSRSAAEEDPKNRLFPFSSVSLDGFSGGPPSVRRSQLRPRGVPMRGRTKLAAATVGVIAAAGAATGVVAAAGNGSGDPAGDLAAAINKRAGTSITAADISGAYQDLLKARLDAAVAAGRLTQAQADEMLARAEAARLGGPGFEVGPGGPGHFGARD
ncbi:MAG: hypothetical protein ABJB09_02195, partial [Verrucomicrobiota bacterium]